MDRDQSRYIQQQGRYQLSDAGKGDALLTGRKALRRQRFLYDELFHAPVIEVHQEHARKPRAERHGIMPPAYRIEVFLMRTEDRMDARRNTAMAQVFESIVWQQQ